jgi:hypothetical protein
MTPSVPALARGVQMTSMGMMPPTGDDELVPLIWSARTVAVYARASLIRMTGMPFDGQTGDGRSFSEWSEIHDQGAESLWYWETRLRREQYAYVPATRATDEDGGAFSERQRLDAERYRAGLRRTVASELSQLSDDAQAKVFLATGGNDLSVTGPVNEYFPDGFTLRIDQRRILELLDGRNIWPDVNGGGR